MAVLRFQEKLTTPRYQRKEKDVVQGCYTVFYGMTDYFFVSTARIPTERANGIQIMKTCEALADAGAHVELVLPKRFNEMTEDPFDYYRVKRNFNIKKIWALDLAPRREPAHPLFYWLQSISFALSALVYLWPQKNAFIHFRYDLPLLIAFTPFFKRRKIICEAHALITGWPRRVMQKCFAVVVVLAAAKEIYAQTDPAGGNRYIVAPDGVSLADFQITESKEQLREELGLPLNKKIIMYTGHFYAWKGINTLIAAAKELDEECAVVLVGGGNRAAEDINRLAHEAGVSHKVMFVGHQPYAKMPRYQKAADCLVLTTVKSGVHEIFTSPLKLFEYMASGVPVVASDSVSVREVLTHRHNGYLVTPEDPRALAEGIRVVLADTHLAASLVQHAAVDVRRYAWDERARRMLAFFNRRATV